MPQSPPHLTGLDLIKLFAIVWICLYHFLDYRYSWGIGSAFAHNNLVQLFGTAESPITLALKYFISFGVLGVNLFLIASGIGLSLSENRKHEATIPFYKKRFQSIMPPYYFLLIIVLIITLLKGRSIDIYDYLTHFLNIHNFFAQYNTSISTPLWYMGLIAQLYLIFPLLFKLSKKIHWTIFVAAALIIQLYLTPQLTNLFGGGRFFSEYLFDFSLGIILGNLLYKKPQFFQSKKWLTLIALAILIIYTLALNIAPQKFITTLFPISSALLIIGLFSLGQHIPQRFQSKVKTLAALSFPVYLTHYFLLTWIWPKVPTFNLWLSEGLFLVGAFIVGFIFEFCYNKVRRVFSKKRVIKPQS